MRSLLALIRRLRPRERRHLWLIAGGITLAALLDVTGIASILPFLTLVADPAAARRAPQLVALRTWLGLDDDRAFLVAMGIGALGILVITSLLNAVLTFAQLLFTNL